MNVAEKLWQLGALNMIVAHIGRDDISGQGDQTSGIGLGFGHVVHAILNMRWKSSSEYADIFYQARCSERCSAFFLD